MAEEDSGSTKRLRDASIEDGDFEEPLAKSRIRQTFTACDTCRKIKARCDVEINSNICYRCQSLGIHCELPEGPKRHFEQNDSRFSSLEQRFARLEDKFDELSSLLRRVIDQPAGPSSSSHIPAPLPEHHVSEYVPEHTPEKIPERIPLQLEGLESPSDSGSDDGDDETELYVPQPVVLIRNLQSQFFGQKGDFTSESFILGDIVTRGLIPLDLAESLLPIFVDHFGSWLSIFPETGLPANLRETQPLFFSAACLLASRFVSSVPKPMIYGIYAQVRRLSASVLLNAPPLDYETLQALLLLSVWSPTIQTSIPIDGWLLSGIALNHALLSFDFLENEGPMDMSEDALRERRLWNGLCVTQLHFSIGNARPCNLQQKYLNQCPRILSFPQAQLISDGRLVAEIELYSIIQDLLGNKQFLRRGETRYEPIAQWRNKWTHLFNYTYSLFDLASPFGELLLFQTSLRLGASSPILLSATLHAASFIVTRFLEISERAILDTADHNFFIIAYASLTLCKFTINDPLITRVRSFLFEISLNDEHIAYRFACIIRELQEAYSRSQVTKVSADAVRSDKDSEGNSGLYSSLMDTLPEGYDLIEELLVGFFSADGQLAYAPRPFAPCKSLAHSYTIWD